MQILRCLPALSAFALVSPLIGCGAVVDDRARDGALPSVSIDAVDDALLRTAHEPSADWLTHGRDYAETRYSPLAQIDGGNVAELGLIWSFSTGTDRGLEATPIVANGTIFTTGSWSIVYALDARTGEPLWTWDPEVDRSYGQRACCDVVNRGVAAYRGKVYVGVFDGRLVALDAETGEPVWETVTVDQERPYTITGAPRVVQGKVIIGNGGAEYGVRGYVSAYDAETGELVWRFYTVPGDPREPFESEALALAAQTWSGRWWEVGGGGTAWDSFAYDPDLDLLYVGTGNGSPWNREARSDGGDNLYLSSVLALRPDDGELVWHYQTTPGDSWDFTATQHMILADMEIGGEMRQVLMQAPKNGFFYVLDRSNGELISAEPFVSVNWATHVDLETGRPVEVPEARYVEEPFMMRPGPLGAHNWHPMSYNPETGLVYVPAQENWFGYAQARDFEFRPEVWNTGITFGAAGSPPEASSGHLSAWDPVAQEERWRVPYDELGNGGTMTTAGNLVFQGTADGRLAAYSADQGELLWEAAVGGGIIAPPATYQVDGVQHVSIMAGWGGVTATSGGGSGRETVPGRMLSFALGGSASLPNVDAPARERPEPIPANGSAEEIRAGEVAYAQSCSVCHGDEAVSGGVIPDLRYATPETFATFDDIVLGGSRVDAGMPSFAEWLTPEDVDAIRAYLLDRRSRME